MERWARLRAGDAVPTPAPTQIQSTRTQGGKGVLWVEERKGESALGRGRVSTMRRERDTLRQGRAKCHGWGRGLPCGRERLGTMESEKVYLKGEEEVPRLVKCTLREGRAKYHGWGRRVPSGREGVSAMDSEEMYLKGDEQSTTTRKIVYLKEVEGKYPG